MPTKNLLLDHLPSDVLSRLEPDLETVYMQQDEVIHQPGEDIAFLYFPLDCMISITVSVLDGRTIETGAVGNREVAGIKCVYGRT